ncbi:MAG: hypothetical protein LIO85_03380 [Rikenellaceae bacterium]|nr:hypothetical protein [Rikenellaceae bacterium]
MSGRLVIIIFAVTILTSCRTRDPFAMERAAVSVADRSVPDTRAVPPPSAREGDIVPVFVGGRSRTTVRKDSCRTVFVTFDAERGKTLRAYLSSKDPEANIRISQIVMPDGTMDGPFGWNMTYDLPETGTYRLAIHENMMAGRPWGSDFKVELALK